LECLSTAKHPGRSEKLREIRARNQSLLSAYSRPLLSPTPKPSVWIGSTKGADLITENKPKGNEAVPQLLVNVRIVPQQGGSMKTAQETRSRLPGVARRQGFADDTRSTEPEYYDSGKPSRNLCQLLLIFTARYFRNTLIGVCNSALVAAFEVLVQNLFKGATRASSSISAALANLMKREALLEAESEATRAKPEQIDCLQDVRSLYNLFDLDPAFTTYACCPLPTCSAIYPLFPEIHASSFADYGPLRCTHTKFGKPCNEPLMQGFQSRGDSSVPKPIKPFHYHHFHDHVASMLARPGIEDAVHSHIQGGLLEKELTDIMSSPTLHSFVDHSGHPYIQVHGEEIRLVWALSADWYNPRGNKASGKMVSTGVVAMVCLSLPPHLRNLEENIYLAGLIPGPQEPSVDATNQFLFPLINDLNVSYQRGIRYSKTHCYPNGRTSRSAIVPVIADTMASKKITGNCSHSATHFCSRCRLHRDCIANLDSASWPPGLTRSEHQMKADQWRDAESKAKQNALFKEHGLRWSPLLLLPYWQPSAWTITEAVHVILLGLIPRHCRDLLGLNFKDLPSDDTVDDPPSPSQLKKAKKILESGHPGRLQSLTLNVLRFLCVEKGTPLPAPKKGRRTKREYISALLVGCIP
jgi:hypothetical protein